MSIDLAIVGDHGKGEFRASIKINEIFTPGRNITVIFRLTHVQRKKDNGDILGGGGCGINRVRANVYMCWGFYWLDT